MARKKVIPLPSIPERSEKRTIQVSLQIETDNLELYRRAAYVVRECIELGFPLYCKDHGIMPATPTKRILTDEEEEQRKELIEKRLRNLKYWKKKEDKGK
jgi:hypothetical protein